jgi:hypothetical protein
MLAASEAQVASMSPRLHPWSNPINHLVVLGAAPGRLLVGSGPCEGRLIKNALQLAMLAVCCG